MVSVGKSDIMGPQTNASDALFKVVWERCFEFEFDFEFVMTNDIMKVLTFSLSGPRKNLIFVVSKCCSTIWINLSACYESLGSSRKDFFFLRSFFQNRAEILPSVSFPFYAVRFARRHKKELLFCSCKQSKISFLACTSLHGSVEMYGQENWSCFS